MIQEVADGDLPKEEPAGGTPAEGSAGARRTFVLRKLDDLYNGLFELIHQLCQGADVAESGPALLRLSGLLGEAIDASDTMAAAIRQALALPELEPRAAVMAMGAAILDAALAGGDVPVGTVLGLPGGSRWVLAPDAENDPYPWQRLHRNVYHDPDEDLGGWSSAADLIAAGAEVVSGSVPIEQLALLAANKSVSSPATETPADDDGREPAEVLA